MTHPLLPGPQGLYDPQHVYAHGWERGDFVIADNHVLLHGRNPYRSKAPRRLWEYRCWRYQRNIRR